MVDHPNHAPYLAYSLWSYFIVTPPTASAMHQMVNNYTKSGHELAPLLKVILHHPAFYANLDEPDMVKPPIVFVAAGLRNTAPLHQGQQLELAARQHGPGAVLPAQRVGLEAGAGVPEHEHGARLLADHRLPALPDDRRSRRSVAAGGGQPPPSRRSRYPWVSNDTRTKLETYATDYATRNGPTLDSHDHTERQTVIRGNADGRS